MPRYKMAYRARRIVKRKPGIRRRRIYRRRAGRPTRNLKHGGMFVKRKVALLRFYGSGVAGGVTVNPTLNNSLTIGTPVAAAGLTGIYDVPFSIQARLDELENYTELTTLFDAYRIVYMKCKLQTTLSTGTQNATVVPYVEWVSDHDDNVPPTSSMMRQKMGVHTKYFNATTPYAVMTCKPRAQYLLNDTLYNAFAPATRPVWINSTQVTQAHFGIKGIIRNVALPASGLPSPFTLDIEYGVGLKDVQ